MHIPLYLWVHEIFYESLCMAKISRSYDLAGTNKGIQLLINDYVTQAYLSILYSLLYSSTVYRQSLEGACSSLCGLTQSSAILEWQSRSTH